MVYVIVAATILFLILLLYLQQYFSVKKYTLKILDKINASFGQRSVRNYSQDDLANIKKFFEKYKSSDSIDDITANDLDIDKIYKTFNVSSSAPGDDYFYYRLRTPDAKVASHEQEIAYINDNEEVRSKLIVFFYQIGRIRKISFVDFANLIEDSSHKSSYKEYIYILLIVIAIGLLFFDTSFGIAAIIFVLVFNIITYYKNRGAIEAYIIGFNYITNFIDKCNKLPLFTDTPLETAVNDIKNISGKLKKITRNYGLVSQGARQTGAGNPLDIIFDYLRMICHIDIIKFNSMFDGITTNLEDILKLYFKVGELESLLNISSMRKALGAYCLPEFIDIDLVSATNIYHPLLSEPVKNDISVNNSVLITGSNASGKSTFLKAVAVNIILGKTINTCCADEFKTNNFTVFSSMSIKDDITNGDSYFMAEIKAFKRIVDYAKANPDERIIAFTDELLRGTNTIERIAACASILKYLSDNGIFAFSATHDIELTDLLSDLYINYHFDEDFTNDDVIFNYKIKEGKATSKNAIKLLNVMGFDNIVVNNATEMAEHFTDTGKWSLSGGEH